MLEIGLVLFHGINCAAFQIIRSSFKVMIDLLPLDPDSKYHLEVKLFLDFVKDFSVFLSYDGI